MSHVGASYGECGVTPLGGMTTFSYTRIITIIEGRSSLRVPIKTPV